MTTPLPAASVLVMREPYEVLMLRRHEKSSFVPNAWVFPGGIAEGRDAELAAQIGDGSELAALRVTAARETFEESGVWLGDPLPEAEAFRSRLLAAEVSFAEIAAAAPLDLGRLVLASRWITPAGLPKRFDTWFFVARVPDGTVATPEDDEAVEVTWVRPSDALAAHAAGTMQMVFPTLRNLEAIAGFESIGALIDARRGATIEPIMPVLVDGKPTLP